MGLHHVPWGTSSLGPFQLFGFLLCFLWWGFFPVSVLILLGACGVLGARSIHSSGQWGRQWGWQWCQAHEPDPTAHGSASLPMAACWDTAPCWLGSPLSKAGFAGGVLGAPGGTGCLHGPECCCWRGHRRQAVQGTKRACHTALLPGSHPLPLFVEGLGTLKSYETGHFARAAALPVRGPCVQRGRPSRVAAGACSEAISWLPCIGHSAEQSAATSRPSRLQAESRKSPQLGGCELCTPTTEDTETNAQPGSSTA